MMSANSLRDRIEELGPWFQNIDLRGIPTAPSHFLGDYPRVKWRHFADAIPADLTGKTVLEIGCNAGFYAMEMKRRCAAQVIGIDHDETYLAQARFAAEIEGLDIEFRRLSVYDVATLGQRFDVVFFTGVLYHLRHPLLALDLIHAHVAQDLFIFQALHRGQDTVMKLADDYDFEETAIFDDPAFPRLHFIEHRFSHDPTNWWLPNRACSEAMLRSSGFKIEARPEQEVYICRYVAGRGEQEGAVYPARGPI